MKIYKENESLKVEDRVNLELIRYFRDKEKPLLVLIKGFGGSAGNQEGLVDKLTSDYQVVTFSPRNSGNSNGSYNITNFVSDSDKVIDYVSQMQGKKPYGIGHSTGGYAIAKLLEKSPLVEKAVLLSPLIEMSEQNPSVLDWYFKNCIKNNRNPFFLDRYVLADQRFSDSDAIDFLRSLYESPECSSKLSSPTLVLLSGATCMRLPISNKELTQLKNIWEDLGAKVEVHGELNHFFSGRWYQGINKIFSELEKSKFYDKLKGFLS
jgi:pimeloyl-ACP methyl ester carboxylesterase